MGCWFTGQVDGVDHPPEFHYHCGMHDPKGTCLGEIRLGPGPVQFWCNSSTLDLACKLKEVGSGQSIEPSTRVPLSLWCATSQQHECQRDKAGCKSHAILEVYPSDLSCTLRRVCPVQRSTMWCVYQGTFDILCVLLLQLNLSGNGSI